MEKSGNLKTEDKNVLPRQINNLRKKSRDYFFDFFMLFLAVTLGFFVNNLSEDHSDRQREKQYMRSLLNDLISDTIQINEIHSSIKHRISGIDSLLQVMEDPGANDFVSNLYYYALKYLNSATFYSGSDRTISQLKSAGGLRLIRKISISDSIANYYSSSENVKYNTEFCFKEFNNILDLEKEIFHFNYTRIYIIESLRNRDDLKLLSNDPLIISRFYNQVLFYLSSLINYNNLITDLQKESESLINLLKESYNI